MSDDTRDIVAAGRGHPLTGPYSAAQPYTKEMQLARGPHKYRRKVAPPKQRAANEAAKLGPCRVCCSPHTDSGRKSWSESVAFHHVIPRDWHGDDVADNLVPLCRPCHANVHRFPGSTSVRRLLASLSDAEYAYAVGKAGEGFAERIYGIEYER